MQYGYFYRSKYVVMLNCRVRVVVKTAKISLNVLITRRSTRKSPHWLKINERIEHGPKLLALYHGL